MVSASCVNNVEDSVSSVIMAISVNPCCPECMVLATSGGGGHVRALHPDVLTCKSCLNAEVQY